MDDRDFDAARRAERFVIQFDSEPEIQAGYGFAHSSVRSESASFRRLKLQLLVFGHHSA